MLRTTRSVPYSSSSISPPSGPAAGAASAGGLRLPLFDLSFERISYEARPVFGHLEALDRSTRVTPPVLRSMMPIAFLGISSGFFFSFFVFSVSALVGDLEHHESDCQR